MGVRVGVRVGVPVGDLERLGVPGKLREGDNVALKLADKGEVKGVCVGVGVGESEPKVTPVAHCSWQSRASLRQAAQKQHTAAEAPQLKVNVASPEAG